MAETVISEAPAESTGAENNQVRGPLSVEDLAASFVEQVETDQEAQQADEAKAEVTETPEEAEASADQEDVLSQSVTESDEEEDEGEDTEEEEVEEEVEEETQSKGLKKTLKQISRLTARAKSAEETVESLKSEIQNLKQSGGSQSQPAQPELENIQSFEDLENLKREAQAAKKFALQHIGKDFVEVDGKEYSDDDIRNILTQADEYLTEKIPQRSEYLREKSEWSRDTINTHPWMDSSKDDDISESRRETYNQLRNQYGNVLDNLPNGDFIAATLVRGIEALKSEQSAKAPKKVVKKRKAPPPTDGGDASPPIENSTTRKQKEKAKILDRKGPLSANDLAAFLAD
jgi:hypothetical protein